MDMKSRKVGYIYVLVSFLTLASILFSANSSQADDPIRISAELYEEYQKDIKNLYVDDTTFYKILSSDNEFERLKPLIDQDASYKHLLRFSSVEMGNSKLYKQLQAIGAKRVLLIDVWPTDPRLSSGFVEFSFALSRGDFELIKLASDELSEMELKAYFGSEVHKEYKGDLNTEVIDYLLSKEGITVNDVLPNGLCSLFDSYKFYVVLYAEDPSLVLEYKDKVTSWIRRAEFEPSKLPISKECAKKIKIHFPDVYEGIKGLYNLEEEQQEPEVEHSKMEDITDALQGLNQTQTCTNVTEEASSFNHDLTDLMIAVLNNDFEAVSNLLKYCPDEEVTDVILKNAHEGNDRKYLEATIFNISEMKIDYCADIDYQDLNFGYTALIIAAKEGNHKIIELLLKKGANPNIKASGGDYPDETALEVATYGGDIESVEALLNGGAIEFAKAIKAAEKSKKFVESEEFDYGIPKEGVLKNYDNIINTLKKSEDTFWKNETNKLLKLINFQNDLNHSLIPTLISAP